MPKYNKKMPLLLQADFSARADIVGKTHNGVGGHFSVVSCMHIFGQLHYVDLKKTSGALFTVANQLSINIVSSRQEWM